MIAPLFVLGLLAVFGATIWAEYSARNAERFVSSADLAKVIRIQQRRAREALERREREAVEQRKVDAYNAADRI